MRLDWYSLKTALALAVVIPIIGLAVFVLCMALIYGWKILLGVVAIFASINFIFWAFHHLTHLKIPHHG